MKVVVDTNVFISRALSEKSSPARLFEKLQQQGTTKVLVSEEILSEYRRVLGYERTRKRHNYASEQIDRVINELLEIATIITPDESLNVVEADPSDNKFLECAVAGSADYIVSGDKHLLGLGEYEGIRILSPADFLRALEQEQSL